MTCFSIQKFVLLGLAAVLIGFPALTGVAQDETGAPMSGTSADDDAPQEQQTDAPIVIELFTTSDCSACVLAERALYDAMKDKNVIALSCHASGSAQSGSPQLDPCTFRQWTYSAGKNKSDVTLEYPTFVINGDDKLGPRSLSYFNATLGHYHYLPKNQAMNVLMKWKAPDTLTLYMPQNETQLKDNLSASIWLFRYQDVAVQKVDAGINKGKVLRFSNIVQSIRHVGKWHGESRMIDLKVAAPPGGEAGGGYAVIVSELMGSDILAAGKLADYAVKPAAAKP